MMSAFFYSRRCVMLPLMLLYIRSCSLKMFRWITSSQHGIASLAPLDPFLPNHQIPTHCRSSREVGLRRSQSDECIARNRRRCRDPECGLLLGPLDVIGLKIDPILTLMVEKEYECPLCGTTRGEIDIFGLRMLFAEQNPTRKRRRER